MERGDQMRDCQGQLISNMPNTRWVFVNCNGQTNVSFPGLDFNRRILQVLSMETGNRNSEAGIFQAYPRKSGFADTWKVHLLVLAKSSFQIPRVWLKDQTTGRSETFGEAGRHVTNVGAGLAKLGVGAGTVVCVWASNYVEYWLVSWDNWRIKYNINFWGDKSEFLNRFAWLCGSWAALSSR